MFGIAVQGRGDPRHLCNQLAGLDSFSEANLVLGNEASRVDMDFRNVCASPAVMELEYALYSQTLPYLRACCLYRSKSSLLNITMEHMPTGYIGARQERLQTWPEILLFVKKRQEAIMLSPYTQRGILLLAETSVLSRKVKLVSQFAIGGQHPVFSSSIASRASLAKAIRNVIASSRGDKKLKAPPQSKNIQPLRRESSHPLTLLRVCKGRRPLREQVSEDGTRESSLRSNRQQPPRRFCCCWSISSRGSRRRRPSSTTHVTSTKDHPDIEAIHQKRETLLGLDSPWHRLELPEPLQLSISLDMSTIPLCIIDTAMTPSLTCRVSRTGGKIIRLHIKNQVPKQCKPVSRILHCTSARSRRVYSHWSLLSPLVALLDHLLLKDVQLAKLQTLNNSQLKRPNALL
ncbi:hypothetical protein PR048_011943 [Dryococelus australis]|uniref:Uncharacterized protein n=1 Tax=Dryococelus australis TaxID=614101 RepID=A0ABQ9HP96_9NEOP|nr:hypothetical protein PR048_011943 [Dryococelus australis]